MIPLRAGRMRTTSAADLATSVPSFMWTLIVAWVRATASFVLSPQNMTRGFLGFLDPLSVGVERSCWI